jgi:hypothetical protein
MLMSAQHINVKIYRLIINKHTVDVASRCLAMRVPNYNLVEQRVNTKSN